MSTLILLLSCAKTPAPEPAAAEAPITPQSSADCVSACLTRNQARAEAWESIEAECVEECGGGAVVLPCVWPEGLEVRYDYVRERTNVDDPALAEVSATTPVTVTVRESRPDYSRIEYASGETRFDGPKEAIEAARIQLGDVSVPPMQLVMHDGTVDEVANRAEVLEVMMEVVERTMPPRPDRDRVLATTRALFEDPETGNPLLLRDVGKLFAMHCIVATPGEAMESEMLFPNPIGGPPIAGTSSVRFGELDEVARTLRVETRDATDPEAIAALVPQLVARYLPEGAELTEENMAEILERFPPIENELVGEMVYSVDDGFPQMVEMRQTVGTEGGPHHRTDRWRWTRVR